MKLSICGVALLAALSLSGCVSSDHRVAGRQAAQASIIHHACGGIMGLRPGEMLHRDCVTSLGQSAVYAGGPDQDANLRTSRERNACAHIGLTPGTGPFINCVSNLNATITAPLSGGNH